MNRDNLLIAGGAGYVGSHTAKVLFQNGRRSVVVDNLCTGNREAVKWSTLIEGRIGDRELMRRVIEEEKIGGAILFAAHAYVGESTQNPLKYYRNNIAETIGFLESLVDGGVKHLVFSSSCSIYGVQDLETIDESAKKDPLSPYAESKWMMEQMLQWLEPAYGLKSVSLRYFNAAGAESEGEIGEDHDPETHLIPLAIRAAAGQGALKVFGSDYPTPDGTAIRDYIHVSDLARAHLMAINYLENGGESTCLNLGTGRGCSVKEVISAVEACMGNPCEVEYASRRKGDAPKLVANAEQAERVLGWKAEQSSLNEIVDGACRWFRKKAIADGRGGGMCQ